MYLREPTDDLTGTESTLRMNRVDAMRFLFQQQANTTTTKHVVFISHSQKNHTVGQDRTWHTTVCLYVRTAKDTHFHIVLLIHVNWEEFGTLVY